MRPGSSTDGDVTRAQAEGEARLRALLQAAADAIISIDEHGLIQLLNPAAEQMFGYSAQELIGTNVSRLMPPPYQEEHDGYLARYLATGQKRILGIGREVVGQRQDGTTFPLDLSVAEARLGDWRAFVGILRDLSERRRAEEGLARLAAIVESSDDAIVTKNLDGTIVTWNAGAERLFGYSAADMIGSHISRLAPAERPCEMPAILERIRRGERVDHYQTTRIRKDGRSVDVSISISPIRDSTGKVIGASAIKRDITEQKRANDEIRTMTQQLWHTAKLASVGELAASIAHELNNPLATVSLRVEALLAQVPAEDPKRRPLEVVEQEVERMGALVANLLQFSRRAPQQASTLDVREELLKSVELVQHHLRNRRIEVRQELAPDVPMLVTDRQHLRQVFLNLLTNASDAMPEGGTLTLRVAPGQLDDERPAVVIEIIDTGLGIPPEHLAKVMEPFFTTKEEGKGTGLGLAICRRVVQDQQGALHIFSEVGRGTTVRVALPVLNGAKAVQTPDD